MSIIICYLTASDPVLLTVSIKNYEMLKGSFLYNLYISYNIIYIYNFIAII